MPRQRSHNLDIDVVIGRGLSDDCAGGKTLAWVKFASRARGLVGSRRDPIGALMTVCTKSREMGL